jgi:hypothetical protein
VLDLLADGSVNLSTLRLLAPHLCPDNFETLVCRARHRSKRDVEVLVAELAPRPDVAASVRKLPERRPIPPIPRQPPVSATETTGSGSVAREACISPSAPGAASRPSHVTVSRVEPIAVTEAAAALLTDRPVVAPLSPGRYRLQFTMSATTHEKLRQAQDLLRREVPDGNPDSIIDRALTLLLEDVARRKLAATSNPRSSGRTGSGSRHIPAQVKRAVWLRDDGRCAFVGSRGRRCSERAFLEFHHREPYAIGGEPTVGNIALRCRAHNLHEDELLFGPRAPGRSPVALRSGARDARPRDARSQSLNSPRGELTSGLVLEVDHP